MNASDVPRRRNLSLGLAGLGLILAGTAIWLLFAQARAGSAPLPTDFSAVPAAVDFMAPDLRLSDLQGVQHELSDYTGQVVLVNLWATWCPPCAAEMPNFQRFFEKHATEGFIVVAVNDGESRKDVEAFAIAHQLTFPIWLDPTYQATDHAFKTANLPTSYVVDRGGRVRLMWIGAISDANLEKYVTSLIKE